MPRVGIKLNAKIVGKQLEDALFVQTSIVLNEKFRIAKRTAEEPIRNLVVEYIKNSPEYQSLDDDNIGSLYAQLGLPDRNVLDELLDIWKQEIHLDNRIIKVTKYKINGGMNLQLLRGDYRNVLSIGEYVSENAKGNQTLIPWLDWLLFRGDTTVVAGWKVSDLGDNNIPDDIILARSRTGLALMRRDDGSSYYIPPEYSGTKADNFITRSLYEALPAIQKIIIEAIDNARV